LTNKKERQQPLRTTPAGVKRFVPPEKQETFSVLCLSWWFLDSPILSPAGRESFIGFLERQLPEALPKRYGLYEPPQHVYAETGKTHLLQFLNEHAHDFVIWYPHRPVTSVHLALPKTVGGTKLGFRTNLLEIEIESAVLSQPGWAENLHLLWRKLSGTLRPIYGDIRVLGGRSRRGAAVYITPAEDDAEDALPLTKGWWWRGVPKSLGCAVVLGEEYQKLWPAFLSDASIENGLAFVTDSDWSSTKDLSERVGRPPKSIEMRKQAKNQRQQEYPAVWPFGPPFDPPRDQPEVRPRSKFLGLF
jgi:hypothetical protein